MFFCIMDPLPNIFEDEKKVTYAEALKTLQDRFITANAKVINIKDQYTTAVEERIDAYAKLMEFKQQHSDKLLRRYKELHPEPLPEEEDMYSISK